MQPRGNQGYKGCSLGGNTVTGATRVRQGCSLGATGVIRVSQGCSLGAVGAKEESAQVSILSASTHLRSHMWD